MITEKDLQEAIAECQGKRNPDSSTCIKLAAFLTIQRELFGPKEQQDNRPVSYSHAGPPVVGESEFSNTISTVGMDRTVEVMDELMQTLSVINPKLYKSVIRKLLD